MRRNKIGGVNANTMLISLVNKAVPGSLFEYHPLPLLLEMAIVPGVHACLQLLATAELGSFAQNLPSKLGILVFSIKCKVVLWLSVRNLVDPEPVPGSCQEARHGFLNIFQTV